MASAATSRYGGLAAMLGGLLSILFAFAGEEHPAHVPLDAARYVFLVLGIVGVHLYLRQSDRYRRLGQAGFFICAFIFALIALFDIGILLNEGVEQWYEAVGPVRGPLLILGLLLFGAASLRTASLPRGGAWLLIAAAGTAILGILAMIISGGSFGGWIFSLSTVLFGLGWIWLGYGLWSAGPVSVAQPRPL